MPICLIGIARGAKVKKLSRQGFEGGSFRGGSVAYRNISGMGCAPRLLALPCVWRLASWELVASWLH